jgi:hypothetical protein
MSLDRDQLLNLLLAEQILIRKQGSVVVINPHWDTKVVHVPKLFYMLRELYPWTEESIRERVHCLVRDVSEPPGCSGCGKFVTFNLYRNRYNSYCHRVCPSTTTHQ